MDEKHKRILQTSFSFLVKNVHNIEEICDHLEVADILTPGMVDCIKHKKPAPSAQVRELASILPRRGKKAYEAFVDALEESKNPDVADYLRQKEGKPAKPKIISEPAENGWPNLKKGVSIIQKKEIKPTSDDDFKQILKDHKVYPIRSKKRGKFIIISNVPDHELVKTCEEKCENQSNPSETSVADCIERARQHVDFDKSSMQQFFKYMQFETKVLNGNKEKDLLKEVSEEVNKNEDFDMLVVVFLSGGMGYESGEIYDAKKKKVPRNEVLDIIRKSEVFEGKPKVVIIDTYNFEDLKPNSEPYDTLHAQTSGSNPSNNLNTEDMFVVTSEPKQGLGPWMMGKDLRGSFFIQALLDVFKKQAYNKSFLELIEQVNKCLYEACVPDKSSESTKKNVGVVVLLEKCHNKELYFFPGRTEKEIHGIPAPIEDHAGPKAKKVVSEQCNTDPKANLAKAKEGVSIQGKTDPTTETQSEVKPWSDFQRFNKKHTKNTTKEDYDKIMQDKEKIYSMTNGKTRGKVIWIVNTMCPNSTTEIQANEDKRIEKCRNNLDIDKTNMEMLLKHVGYQCNPQDKLKNKTAEEIKEFLKCRLEEVDKDNTANHSSLVVMMLSGKSNCDAGKMYDKDGKEIVEEEITKIIRESKHFRGKPKIVIIQSYNFQDYGPFGSVDADVDNSMVINKTPNSDDLFVVSTCPRIEEGPWMIGNDTLGSYFIQAFVHVFKNHAHDKSFIEILKEVHKLLCTVSVPKKDKDGNFTKDTETKHVADVIVTQVGQKEMYFFPLYEPTAVSEKGSLVCEPSN